MNYFSLWVQDKFWKIPRNLSGCATYGIIQCAIVSEIYEYWMSIFSIYLDLWKNRKTCSKFGFHISFYFSLSATFLTEKLIARESQNFKTPMRQLLVHFYQLLIVGWCEPSLASNIDHHDYFLISEFLKIDKIAINIKCLKIKESSGNFFSQLFGAIFINSFSY